MRAGFGSFLKVTLMEGVSGVGHTQEGDSSNAKAL